jgi:hypothetical protein
MATWILFSNPPVNFKFVKVKDASNRWIPDVNLSDQQTCAIWIILFPVIDGYLALIFEPALKI